MPVTRTLPILHLAGKASICRRPVNSALGITGLLPPMRTLKALAYLLALVSTTIFAADITPTGSGRVLLDGQITEGDAERLIRAQQQSMLSLGRPLRTLELNSPGGSIAEAVRLAQLVELFRLDTWVVSEGNCMSSCFILFIAGNSRSALGHLEGDRPTRAIGVHRPTFSEAALRTVDVPTFENKHRTLLARLRTFLVERGVPQDITEKMMRFSSQEIYWLTDKDLLALGFYSPTYEELIVAKCGRSPDVARTLLNPDGSPGADNSIDRMNELGACQSRVIGGLQLSEVPPMLRRFASGWRPWTARPKGNTK